MKTDQKYLSERIVDTDVHAGGLFFCVIYQNCLEFRADGKVLLTKQLVNAFRPMDPADIKRLENYRVTGQYSVNERGYLVCDFGEIFLQYTGMEMESGKLIPFHVFDRRLSKQWGEIYTLSDRL